MIRINPVYKKELKINVRTIKTAFIIFGYNIILAAIGLFLFYADFETNRQYGAIVDFKNMIDIYSVLAVIEFGLVLSIVPAMTANVISGEREKQTLEILLTTKLKPIQIIMGKLSSSISLIILVVFSSIPVLSIVFSVGGITFMDLLELMGLILVTAIFVGSIGVFFSTLFKKTTISTVFTYGTVILLVFGTAILLGMIHVFVSMRLESDFYRYGGTYPEADLGNLVYILLINPAITLVSLFTKQFGSDAYLGDIMNNFGKSSENLLNNWYIYSIAIQLVISVVLIGVSARLLDPLKRKEKVEHKKSKIKKR